MANTNDVKYGGGNDTVPAYDKNQDLEGQPLLNAGGITMDPDVPSHDLDMAGGDIVDAGTVSASGDQTVGGDLTVAGDADVAGDSSVGGDADVTGTTTLQGNVDAQADVVVQGDLEVQGIVSSPQVFARTAKLARAGGVWGIVADSGVSAINTVADNVNSLQLELTIDALNTDPLDNAATIVRTAVIQSYQRQGGATSQVTAGERAIAVANVVVDQIDVEFTFNGAAGSADGDTIAIGVLLI